MKRKEEKFLVGEDKENKILVKKDSKSEGKVLVENQTGVKSIETLRAKIISNAHKRKKPPRNKGKANR